MSNAETAPADAAKSVREIARDATREEAARHTALVLADRVAAQYLTGYAARNALPGAHVAAVTDAGAIRDDDHGVADAMMAARKPVYSWCAHDHHGRDVARKLHDVLTTNGTALDLRHVTLTDPERWTGGTPEFAAILESASPTKPPAIPKPPPVQRIGGAPSAAAIAAQHDDYDVSSLRSAERLLSAHRDRLLVVTDDQDALSDLYVLGDNGIWHRGDNLLKQWMGAAADALKVQAVVHDRLDGKALQAVLLRLRRLYEPRTLDPVREQSAPALHRLIDCGELQPGDVTACLRDDLDANMRYLGTQSGVVDLHSGKLLPPADGRRHLVTLQAAVAFDPAATHPDVDRLFAHLPPDAVQWWWRVLGYHLLGAPSRRFYVAVGPPSGGKTTLANALAATLGPYASRPADDALEARPGGSAGLSPELEAFTTPRRWAIIDEAPRLKIAAPLLKRLSGDGSQTFRRLHEQLRTVPATATVLLICNPGSVPRLRLQDEAMADRLRELPYSAVPTPDPGFKHRIQSDDFRRAFLARLVAAAAGETPGVPPDAPVLVMTATAERVAEDVGELGRFARRIVRGAATLALSRVWQAWCEHNEEPETAMEAGGIGKRRLSSALRDHVPGLPAPKPYSVNGRKVRGWRGWKLDAEVRAEPEAATPGLTPPLNAEEAALVEDYVRQLRAFNAEREAAGIEGLITSEDGLRELALDGIKSRRSLRERWGIDVDNAPAGAHVVMEYDPPLPRCPKCTGYSFEHLNVPADEEVWRKAGHPGRRRCLSCGNVYETTGSPHGRRLVNVRLETPAETEAREQRAAKARAEKNNRELF